jgi:hypothetical protein
VDGGREVSPGGELGDHRLPILGGGLERQEPEGSAAIHARESRRDAGAEGALGVVEDGQSMAIHGRLPALRSVGGPR